MMHYDVRIVYFGENELGADEPENKKCDKKGNSKKQQVKPSKKIDTWKEKKS